MRFFTAYNYVFIIYFPCVSCPYSVLSSGGVLAAGACNKNIVNLLSSEDFWVTMFKLSLKLYFVFTYCETLLTIQYMQVTITVG